MEQIWPENQSRSSLEERIFELGESVPVGDPTAGDIDWLYGQQLDDFIDAWYTLAKYYEISGDTVISVETISYYVDFSRLLRRLMCDNNIDPKHRQQAEDQLQGLDAMMDEVIKEAGTNRNN
jgi:hypothetical protein